MDKLTLLPNYEALLLHLTALLQARREGLDQSSPSAPVLFYVNVDNMSAINALAGHAQGDLVLQHVARQLQLLQPFQGYAARVAGDKFALVLRQCSPEKAHELAAQLCDHPAELAAPAAQQAFCGHRQHRSASDGCLVFRCAAGGACRRHGQLQR
ncbi:diguanylate cyclase domain-containing protein [Comamonas sp. JC664]|uniref:diguanylate cyclase domain-containing protein n=1 Tax=Comamonas sp. JC664 TaxID=2801917 RepID=UPI0036204DD1